MLSTSVLPDELGDMVLAETFYSAREEIVYSVRGYDAVPRRFGIFLQDKYGNETDTLFTELTPIYERELDKTKFQGNVFAERFPRRFVRRKDGICMERKNLQRW